MYKVYEPLSAEECLEYLRKSRSDDPTLTVDEVLANHELELNEYADKYLGGRVPESQVFREVASSETIDDRPEMLKILKAIENPKIKAVLVREPQRLSRGDLEDAGRIIKIFRYTNTLVVTPQRTFDLRDDMDRDYFERELKRGNEYLEYAKKIMNNGKDTAVKKGYFIATFPPYGYRKIHYKIDKEKCSTLEIIDNEADVVRMIFDLYVNEDMGFEKIANRLNELGFKPARGEIWKKESIKDMISNEVYIGKVRWKYRKTVKTIEDQQVKKSNPRSKVSDYLLFDGIHPAIISQELFDLAQAKRGKNTPVRKNMSVVNPFAGILFCAKCGKAVKYRAENGKYKPRLECSEMKHCKNGSARYYEVFDRVCEALEACISDFEVKLDNNDIDEKERHKQLISTLEKRLKELREKEVRQWEKYTDEEMPKAIFDQLNEKVLREKEETKNALCSAYDSMPEPVDYEDKIETFKNALEALKDDTVSAELKNKYLKAIIEKITYERKKPIRLTKALAQEMGVPYPHNLCRHRFPITLDITLRG
jgi:DNA invertase Pin-like site-specific DNA recombinase/uncharacterized protein YlaN (UPF0358 family)